MTQWDDFLIRASLSDNGSLPRQLSWVSPDIIPYGISPVANPAAQFCNAPSYATDPGSSPIYNATNYLYVRAKNLKAGANTGTVFLYYSNSNLLQYPSSWLNNPIGNPDGLPISAANIGDIVTPTQAFVWPQTPPQPANFHYCLIAWVKTAAHGTLPTTDAVADLAAFMAENGNWSQRNIAITEAGSPTFVKSVNYSQGTEPATMNFSLTWDYPPIGAQVQLVARDPAGGKVINSEIQTIQAQNSGFVIPQIPIPGGYKTIFDINYFANGKVPQKSFTLTLNAYYFVPPTQKTLLGYARDMHGFGIGHLPLAMTGQPMLEAAVGIGPQKAVLVGTQEILALVP